MQFLLDLVLDFSAFVLIPMRPNTILNIFSLKNIVFYKVKFYKVKYLLYN